MTGKTGSFKITWRNHDYRIQLLSDAERSVLKQKGTKAVERRCNEGPIARDCYVRRKEVSLYRGSHFHQFTISEARNIVRYTGLRWVRGSTVTIYCDNIYPLIKLNVVLGNNDKKKKTVLI